MTKKRVFVAGHRGMVGSAIVRQLANKTDIELITQDVGSDLTNQATVFKFFEEQSLMMYLAAAKVD